MPTLAPAAPKLVGLATTWSRSTCSALMSMEVEPPLTVRLWRLRGCEQHPRPVLRTWSHAVVVEVLRATPLARSGSRTGTAIALLRGNSVRSPFQRNRELASPGFAVVGLV